MFILEDKKNKGKKYVKNNINCTCTSNSQDIFRKNNSDLNAKKIMLHYFSYAMNLRTLSL